MHRFQLRFGNAVLCFSTTKRLKLLKLYFLLYEHFLHADESSDFETPYFQFEYGILKRAQKKKHSSTLGDREQRTTHLRLPLHSIVLTFYISASYSVAMKSKNFADTTLHSKLNRTSTTQGFIIHRSEYFTNSDAEKDASG